MISVLDPWLKSHCPLAGLPTLNGISILLGFMTTLAVLGAILPSRPIPGTKLADGSKIVYNCNGFSVLFALVLLLTIGIYLKLFSPTVIADIGGDLFATTLLFVMLVSTLLQIIGQQSSSTSASLKPHTTNNIFLDWWLGVQLNPSFLGIDLKFFWLRPGMMGWLLINLSIAAKEYEQKGSLSLSMALYQTFTGFYVLDYFWHEEYMTSTWDIVAENFGFMLVFGDLVFVPFTFSIQAWWLLQHPVELTPPSAFLIVFIFLVGYFVFRGANKQKHVFKHNPKAPIWGSPPLVIGGRLLASGFWGMSRHCNYLGDLLLALSYSLPCGSSSVIPYFYPTYLFILLVLRERRDESRCKAKYKEIWVEYCSKVPWRIFPYIY